MDIGRMRVEVTNTYPGKKWREKVRKMSDGQVTALFYRFLNDQQKKRMGELFDRANAVIEREILSEVRITTCPIEQIYPNCTSSNNGRHKIIKIPYEDTVLFGYTVCTKEQIFQCLQNTVGKALLFEDHYYLVNTVIIEETDILIYLG